LPNDDHIQPHDSTRLARSLRRQSTVPERLLWGRLRSGRLYGVKFRRQHPIGPYIVDFCCATVKVVIELDGMSHVGRAEQDEQRSAYLRSHGYRVIRYTNDQVISAIDSVVEDIARQIEQ
jgi:very-short-patch-repair endonuclease